MYCIKNVSSKRGIIIIKGGCWAMGYKKILKVEFGRVGFRYVLKKSVLHKEYNKPS